MADGSITIDTSINQDGVNAGMKRIEQSLNRIANILTKISGSIGAGIVQAGVGLAEDVSEAADQVDAAGKSAEQRIDKAKSELNKSTEDIKITRGDDNVDYSYDGPLQKAEILDERTLNSMAQKTKEASEYMANYSANLDKASGRETTLNGQIKKVRAELKALEEQGVGPKDKEYDRQYAKLTKLTAQLNDYKKSMTAIGISRSQSSLTIEGKIADAKATLAKLEQAGKGIEDADYAATKNRLAELVEQYKKLNAEASKTDAQKAAEEAVVAEAQRIKEIGENAEISKPKIVALNEELARLKARQADLSKAGVTSGYKEYDQNASRIAEINSQLKSYQNSLDGTAVTAKKNIQIFGTLKKKLDGLFSSIAGIFKKIFTSAKKTKSLSDSTTFSLKKGIKTLLKYGLGIRSLYALLNKLRSAITEGIKSLVKYDSQTNASMTSVTSALTRLKNSLAAAFAPILNTVAPILTQFINLLSEVATKAGMVFAALAGQSTFTKAIAVQQDYAESLDSSASAAEDSADATKEARRAAAGFDELNVISKNETDSTSTTAENPAEFDTVSVVKDVTKMAEKLKKIFKKIFTPFKNAWKKEGQATVAAAEYALKGLGTLAKSVGSSLMEVWTNGTGEQALTTLLKIIQNILNTVGNIALALDEAWNTNGVGTEIIQGIADIFQDVLDFIRDITAATEEWSRSIDFYPLLDSIRSMITDDIEPAVKQVLSLLSDLYKTIVLPMLTWLIETALPIVNEIIGDIAEIVGILAGKFQEAWDNNETGKKIVEDIQGIFETILGTIDDLVESTKEWAENLDLKPLLTAVEEFLVRLDPAIDTIGEIFTDVYENIIQPALKWIIEEGLPWVLDKLGDLADWISEHKEAIENFGKVLIAAFAAEKIGGLVAAIIGHILNLVSNVKTLKNLLGENGLLGTIGKIISASTKKGGLTTVLESLSKAAGGTAASTATSTATTATTATAAGGIGAAGAAGVGAAAAVGVIALTKLSEAQQSAAEEAQGYNGILTEMGSLMDSMAQSFTPELRKKLETLTDELENQEADTETAAAAYADFFSEAGIGADTLTDAYRSLGGEASKSEEQIELFDAIINKIGADSQTTGGIAQDEADAIKEKLQELYVDGLITSKTTLDSLNGTIDQSVASGSTMTETIQTLSERLQDMEYFGGEAAQELQDAFPAAEATASTAKTAIEETTTAAQTAATSVGTLKSDMTATANGIKDALETNMGAAETAVETATAGMKTAAETDLSSVEQSAEESASGVNTATVTKWGDSAEEVSLNLREMKLAASQCLAEMTETVKSYATSQYNILTQKWEYIAERVGQIITEMNANVKELLNTMITNINTMVSRLNSVLGQIESSFSYDMTVQTADGSKTAKSSVTFPKLSSVPYLASGAVIPANKEFLAVLGDQKSGTNVEAPEGLIRKIIREELGNQGSGSGQQTINLSIDGQKFFSWIIEQNNQYADRTGRSAFQGA